MRQLAGQTICGVAVNAELLHELDSEEYLRDVLWVLPHLPRDRYLELALKYWSATRATLDPVELAQEIGPLTIPPAI